MPASSTAVPRSLHAGGVGEVLAQPDHGGLMADGVHTAQRLGHVGRLPQVRPVELHPLGIRGVGAVGRGQQRVEDAYLVPGVGEGGDDVRADEARASGDQDQHDPTVRERTRPAAAQRPDVRNR
jgi:hypothetical protein